MELYENIAEYYDELYPTGDDKKKFYAQETSEFITPVKYLTIGCGTGTFEHYLAKGAADVTGIEVVPSFLESANRKRRTQLMALRFFQMSSLEMCRFLGKGFYDIISLPCGRAALTHDATLMAKLFYDCKQLLAPQGKLILQLPHFEKYANADIIKLPQRESIRVKLFSRITTSADGKKLLQQDLETGNGRHLLVSRDVEIFPLTQTHIGEYARDAGFTKCSFYADFDKNPLLADSDELIAVIS